MSSDVTKPAVVATVVRMTYVPSQVGIETGIKGSPGHMREYVGNKRVVGGGSGTFVTATKTRFILRIKIGGEEYDIWTEDVFRRLLGISRLMPRIREEIILTMPSQVKVVENRSLGGRRYYSLSESSAEAWARRIRVVRS